MKIRYYTFFSIIAIVLVAITLLFSGKALAETYVDQSFKSFGKSLDNYRAQNPGLQSLEAGGFDTFLFAFVRRTIGLGDSENLTASAIQKSPVGQIGQGIAMMYEHPPANTGYWLADVGQSLGFYRPAYAQNGVGFTGLQPILGIWKQFRNIAYVLLALAMIVVGFMIMFRRKIDPQTVVTVQNALPRIITTLIFITFSYAIAGFMIDLMYVIMIVVLNLISGNIAGYNDLIAGSVTSTPLQNLCATGVTILGCASSGAFDLMGRVFSPLLLLNPGRSLGTALVGILAGGAIGNLPGALLGGLAASLISGVSLPVPGGSAVPGGFLSPILLVLFAIALLFAFFRIFFMLLGAYIQVLIGVITAPIQILIDVIPGSNGFVSWFMHMVNNLATFVIVGVMLAFVSIIVDSLGSIGGAQQLWVPPIIGGQDPGLLKVIIGVGGMLMIPSVVSNIKKALKAPSAFPVAGGIGGGLSAPLTTGLQLLSLAGGIQHLRPGTPHQIIKPDTGGGKGGHH